MNRFSTWPYQFQFETPSGENDAASVLLPDAYTVIAYSDDSALPPIESALFFEWDRSTEARGILRATAHGYDRFYRSGAFAERCGGTIARVRGYPFRTVFAVRTDARRNNLLEELARPWQLGTMNKYETEGVHNS